LLCRTHFAVCGERHKRSSFALADADDGDSLAIAGIAGFALVQPDSDECSNSSIIMLHLQLQQCLDLHALESGQALP